jgi:dCMP deaminase
MSRPSWDEYFINIAHAVATRSEDPSSKVGCVIVDEDNGPISFGYNGFIAGCDECGACLERPMKYHLVIHAEMNALLFAKQKLKGAKLYSIFAPCDNCLKHILQSGIRYIIFEQHEPITRFSDDQLEACLKLMNSVEMESIHHLEGIWYGNIIQEEIKRRWNELHKPTQSQLL